MKKQTSKKIKIFATCGSSLEFDDLTKKLDEINKNNEFDVTIQIGKGKYTPKNLNYFKFTNDMDKYYDWADLVITHTGAGTIFELLNKHKKIIAVANRLAVNNHELVIELSNLGIIKFLGVNLNLLNSGFLNNSFEFKIYTPEKIFIAKVIKGFFN